MSYGIYRWNGPCWTIARGYHTPTPLPAHIMRIIQAPTKKQPDSMPQPIPDSAEKTKDQP